MLNNISLYIYVQLLQPFIHQWSVRLFPCLGSYNNVARNMAGTVAYSLSSPHRIKILYNHFLERIKNSKLPLRRLLKISFFIINNLEPWQARFLLKGQVLEILSFMGQQKKLMIPHRCLCNNLKYMCIKCENYSQPMGNNTNGGSGPDLIHGCSWMTPDLENFLLAFLFAMFCKYRNY